MRLLTTIILTAAVIVAASVYPKDGARDLVMSPREITLPGNGKSTATISINATNASLDVVDGARRVVVERVRAAAGGSLATIRAGVLPGSALLEATAPGFPPARIAVTIVADNADSFQDGTPDYLRLSDRNQEAFRDWFAQLAEAVYATAPGRRSREINDCAALLRFAYREALRPHDGAWASVLGLDVLPSPAAIEAWHYPHTPLGAGIFRVKTGAFLPADTADRAFAEFADAETLRRFNTHLVSRDIRRARQGDLLFYRQEGQRMPDHAMIYLEHSQFESGGGPWAVYHTGPTESDPGEMRRPTIAELAGHPEPRWRPAPANPNFLGVYRWNILR
jgi:uncharacterized protein YfaT (DUF1175 family)